MNRVLKAFCVVASVAVTMSAAAEVLTDQDFRTVIHTAGDSIWPTITGNCTSPYSQNNAFDGFRFSSSTADKGKSWLSSFKRRTGLHRRTGHTRMNPRQSRWHSNGLVNDNL